MRRLVPALVAALLLASVAAGAGPALSHDAGVTNYTAVPADRTPGTVDVTYRNSVVLTENFDIGYRGFDSVTSVTLEWAGGSFARCGGPDDELARTFGVDRGDDANGSTVDSSFDVDSASFGESRERFEVAEGVSYARGDELVLAQNTCYTNPGPGWHRITVNVTGTSFSTDDTISFEESSHYFWICDCDNESHAREKLGPPPSERSTPTPTPTATPTPTPTATPTPTPEPTPTPTPRPTPTPKVVTVTVTPDPTPTPTASPTPTSTATPAPTASPTPEVTTELSPSESPTPTSTATPSPTATPGGNSGTTPGAGTPAGGPGFGPVTVLVAGTVAALALRRLSLKR